MAVTEASEARRGSIGGQTREQRRPNERELPRRFGKSEMAEIRVRQRGRAEDQTTVDNGPVGMREARRAAAPYLKPSKLPYRQ